MKVDVDVGGGMGAIAAASVDEVADWKSSNSSSSMGSGESMSNPLPAGFLPAASEVEVVVAGSSSSPKSNKSGSGCFGGSGFLVSRRARAGLGSVVFLRLDEEEVPSLYSSYSSNRFPLLPDPESWKLLVLPPYPPPSP